MCHRCHWILTRIALRTGAFLFTARYFIVIIIIVVVIIPTHERTPRAPFTALLCYVHRHHRSRTPVFLYSYFRTPFNIFNTTKILYRAGDVCVVSYEDDTRGEYARTHTDADIDDNYYLTFDRFRFLRFHSTRQTTTAPLVGGGYGPPSRVTFISRTGIFSTRAVKNNTTRYWHTVHTRYAILFRARLSLEFQTLKNTS